MFLTALATVGETIFGATFASEVVGISQHGPAAIYTSLKLFLKEDVTHELFVVGGSGIYLRYNTLTEDGRDVIRGVGLVPFLVYFRRDITIGHFLQLQVQNFSLDFTQISPFNIKLQRLHKIRQVGFEVRTTGRILQTIELVEHLINMFQLPKVDISLVITRLVRLLLPVEVRDSFEVFFTIAIGNNFLPRSEQ